MSAAANRAADRLGARLSERRVPHADRCIVVEEVLETFREQRERTLNPAWMLGLGVAIAILKAYLRLHCGREPIA